MSQWPYGKYILFCETSAPGGQGTYLVYAWWSTSWICGAQIQPQRLDASFHFLWHNRIFELLILLSQECLCHSVAYTLWNHFSVQLKYDTLLEEWNNRFSFNILKWNSMLNAQRHTEKFESSSCLIHKKFKEDTCFFWYDTAESGGIL